MYCKKITYQNYRNIETAEITLDEGVNVFYGNNAQGKTNLLEGIYYFACGKSFRSATDKELVRMGSEYASVAVEFFDGQRERRHEVRFSDRDKKICLKENIKITRMSEFIGVFRAVLFSPEHLSIVKEGPAERRNFCDIAISQLYPAYMASLSKYKKLLQNRNAVLKDEESPNSDAMIDVLSAELAKEAAFIAAYREKYVRKLSHYVSDIISDMTCGREKAELFYPSAADESEYMRLLTSNVRKERYAGSTLYGIHKDDIKVTLNGNDSRVYASQGQQRSIALAMKLAEGEISKDDTGEYPVFLFDDILSELDRSRKEYILSKLGSRQVIITCCEDIPMGKIFTIDNGCVQI